MAHFLTRSASSGVVSLLNPFDVDPRDALQLLLEAEAKEAELPISPAVTKKRNVCHLCNKLFTTSGHLTRHAMVHTGMKDNICPFPACNKRCSRHDNLLQHFKMHLSSSDRDRGSDHLRKTLASMTASRASADTDMTPISPSEIPAGVAVDDIDGPIDARDAVPPFRVGRRDVVSAESAVSSGGSGSPRSYTPSVSCKTPEAPPTLAHPFSPSALTRAKHATSSRDSGRPAAQPPSSWPAHTAYVARGYEVSFLRMDSG